jgi:membrane protease subunit HflK
MPVPPPLPVATAIRRRTIPPRRSASIEDIFRSRGKTGPGGGGGGGGIPRLPLPAELQAWLPQIIAGLLVVGLLASTMHQLGSTQQGIVTTFGKYSRTIDSGVSFTLPWPIQEVDVTDVTSIRRDSIPDSDGEKLMVTGDQNLVDLSYLVRWNIRNLKLYDFQLKDPDATVREVAEAAMRATVAEVKLNDVMGGAGRADIEQAVRQRMQTILDTYRSGVVIQGVDIKKADPPEKVVGAFQQVTVAQQEAQKNMSNAQAFAQQVVARAQGDAAAFDKVYAQYKLAPEVTRRRMYYETMERVLAGNDKVIMEGNSTSYLPLPEIRRKADSVDSAADSGSGGTASNPAAASSAAPAGGQ